LKTVTATGKCARRSSAASAFFCAVVFLFRIPADFSNILALAANNP
jgi:hypothetical protein